MLYRHERWRGGRRDMRVRRLPGPREGARPRDARGARRRGPGGQTRRHRLRVLPLLRRAHRTRSRDRVKAFFVLFRLRSLDVMRSGATFVLFMALPLVLLGVVALVFANGHPFERKTVLVVQREGFTRQLVGDSP